MVSKYLYYRLAEITSANNYNYKAINKLLTKLIHIYTLRSTLVQRQQGQNLLDCETLVINLSRLNNSRLI